MCEDKYGKGSSLYFELKARAARAPPVIFQGMTDCTFPYVVAHVEYM